MTRWLAGLVLVLLATPPLAALQNIPADVQLAPPPSPRPVTLPGVDVVLADPGILRGRRVGLVTHQAGLTGDGRLTSAALVSAPGVRVTALFAPEHGIDGTYDAGERVPTVPGRTPVYSLYGRVFGPTRQMLSRLDVLVIDLQDVGVRPFTYTSTMALAMAAARDAGKEIVVLDRPNPMGGAIVDGPVLEPPLRSFVGLYPIPYVFGMTIAELARLYNAAFGIGARLTVVPMRGWTRGMAWPDTGLPWQNPSPGITGPAEPFYYAATGPVDGTNLWNGVATDHRFRVVLAPWIDNRTLAERLNAYGLAGVQFTASAIPHPRTGVIWYGVRLHVTEPRRFLPSTTMVHILAEIRRLHGDQLVFTRPRKGPYLFDQVWGTKNLRLALIRGDAPEVIVAQWQPSLERFRRLRETYLLYR